MAEELASAEWQIKHLEADRDTWKARAAEETRRSLASSEKREKAERLLKGAVADNEALRARVEELERALQAVWNWLGPSDKNATTYPWPDEEAERLVRAALSKPGRAQQEPAQDDGVPHGD